MAKILDKDRVIVIINNGAKINIIGDSIAAGKGSSQSYSSDKVIFEDDIKKFYRIIAPHSCGTLFEN
ncbi:MAG: SGNH/GDSL hydrolase family protein, partial [Clostridium sp.]|nr:SGNH/GDSL hydrolase family protein [Clostridium sp.]